jgi:hypothetical protein
MAQRRRWTASETLRRWGDGAEGAEGLAAPPGATLLSEELLQAARTALTSGTGQPEPQQQTN